MGELTKYLSFDRWRLKQTVHPTATERQREKEAKMNSIFEKKEKHHQKRGEGQGPGENSQCGKSLNKYFVFYKVYI